MMRALFLLLAPARRAGRPRASYAAERRCQPNHHHRTRGRAFDCCARRRRSTSPPRSSSRTRRGSRSRTSSKESSSSTASPCRASPSSRTWPITRREIRLLFSFLLWVPWFPSYFSSVFLSLVLMLRRAWSRWVIMIACRVGLAFGRIEWRFGSTRALRSPWPRCFYLSARSCPTTAWAMPRSQRPTGTGSRRELVMTRHARIAPSPEQLE